MDYFDPFADAEAARARLQDAGTRTLVVSFDTDWRFPTRHSVEIARMLESAGASVVLREIASPLRARLVPAAGPRVPRDGEGVSRGAVSSYEALF